MSRAAGVCIQFILWTSHTQTIRLMLMISPLEPRRKWFKHHLCALIYLVSAPPLPAANKREVMSSDDIQPFCIRWWQSLNPMWRYQLKNKQLCLSLVLQWQPQIKGEMNNQPQEGLLRLLCSSQFKSTYKLTMFFFSLSCHASILVVYAVCNSILEGAPVASASFILPPHRFWSKMFKGQVHSSLVSEFG